MRHVVESKLKGDLFHSRLFSYRGFRGDEQPLLNMVPRGKARIPLDQMIQIIRGHTEGLCIISDGATLLEINLEFAKEIVNQ